MAAPASPAPVPPPRPHRPRRFGLAAVLLLLWLGGRGAGWFGRGEDQPVPASSGPVDPTAAAAPSSPAPAPVTPPTPPSVAAATTTTVLEAADPAPANGPAAAPMPMLESDRGPAVPAEESAAVTPPAEPLAPALDPDRFASQLSLVTERTSSGDLGRAMVSLHHLRRFALDAAQQVAFADAAQRLETALAAVAANLAQALGQGRVLDARAALSRLRGDGEAVLVPWVRQALQLAGCPGDPLAPAVAGVRPIAQPLARGRQVRWRRQGRVEEGRVVDSRSETLTVRVQRGDAVVFPTLAVVEVEPVDASTAEAIEFAFAALQAGDTELARLWWCRVQQQRTGEPSAREQQLATLLP
ncbi:MAG: hypothetical protein MUC36_15550 [Planctomycetes bacterium]|nr:hypothetical protein [Planctomycetota bacterium]